mgnify:CR=1 FL=1
MYEFQNPSDYMIQTYLETSQVIAVVGLSDREETTSNRISKIMQELGYQIVNLTDRKSVV